MVTIRSVRLIEISDTDLAGKYRDKNQQFIAVKETSSRMIRLN